MNRRHFLSHTVSLTAVAIGVTTIGVASAQEAVVPSAAILKALTAPVSKDIRLDTQGRPMPPRDPSIDLQVQFKLDSAELLQLGRLQLDQLAFALQNKALIESGFELAGHTDQSGTYEHNIRLSTARAESVRNYLMTQHRIEPRRLITVGYGYTRLADPARPRAAVNRRVEVRRVLVATPAMGEGVPPARRELGGRIVPAPRP
jgi:outer membrane protein OmpA-like peptidoglycan-associated protein